LENGFKLIIEIIGDGFLELFKMMFENIVQICVKGYFILADNLHDTGKPFVVFLPDVDALVATACHGVTVEETLAITRIGSLLLSGTLFGRWLFRCRVLWLFCRWLLRGYRLLGLLCFACHDGHEICLVNRGIRLFLVFILHSGYSLTVLRNSLMNKSKPEAFINLLSGGNSVERKIVFAVASLSLRKRLLSAMRVSIACSPTSLMTLP